MALAPTAAPPPADPAALGGVPPDMGMDMGAEPPVDEDPGTVVATILKKADGSFVLEGGDEPEVGPDGAPPADMATTEPQTFDDIGDLMTAVHNLIDPENPEGPQAQANFEEGFGPTEEEAPAEPIKSVM